MKSVINEATEWIMEVSGNDNHELAQDLAKVFDELCNSKYM